MVQEPKTDRSRRTIPIPADVVDVLRRHKARQAEHKLLMGQPTRIGAWSSVWRLELGESAKTVQTMLGHSKIATTLDIYSHVSLDLETRAAARLNEALKLAQP
jgi:integrase